MVRSPINRISVLERRGFGRHRLAGRALTESRNPERAGSTLVRGDHEQRTRRGAVRASAVVADPRPVARLAMRHALAREGIAVVAETADAVAAVRAARATLPDICLLDARLPGALAAVREIVAASTETRVVMLFESLADEALIEALRSGAAGCLHKETGPEALGRAVRATLAGEAPLPRAAAKRIIEELRMLASKRRVRTAHGTWTELSRRESQVLELMRQQLTTNEIAERLGISTVTVRRHVSGTMRRLGAHDRDSALRLAAGHPTTEPV